MLNPYCYIYYTHLFYFILFFFLPSYVPLIVNQNIIYIFLTEFLLSVCNMIFLLREIPNKFATEDGCTKKKHIHQFFLLPFMLFSVISMLQAILRCFAFVCSWGPPKFSDKVRFSFNPGYILEIVYCILYRFLLPIGYIIFQTEHKLPVWLAISCIIIYAHVYPPGPQPGEVK